VRADAPPDAKDLFAKARERRLAGDCASALPLFRRTYQLYPAGLGSLRNIAECEDAVGHFASARRAWLDLQHDLLTIRESKYEGWDQDAAQQAARLASKVATLTVDVTVVTAAGQPAPIQRIEVSVNGEPLNPALVRTPLERDPGRYVIRAGGIGASATAEREVDLAEGQYMTVELRVAVEPPGGHATATSERSPRALRTAAWIGAGLGAASLVGAGVAALERQSAFDDLKTECGGSTTTCRPTSGVSADEQARVRAIEDRGHEWTTWVNVLTAVGIVGLSGAVVLYAVSRSRKSETAFVVSSGTISAVGKF
jgi:hypothetical protein